MSKKILLSITMGLMITIPAMNFTVVKAVDEAVEDDTNVDWESAPNTEEDMLGLVSAAKRAASAARVAADGTIEAANDEDPEDAVAYVVGPAHRTGMFVRLAAVEAMKSGIIAKSAHGAAADDVANIAMAKALTAMYAAENAENAAENAAKISASVYPIVAKEARAAASAAAGAANMAEAAAEEASQATERAVAVVGPAHRTGIAVRKAALTALKEGIMARRAAHKAQADE